MSCIRKPMTYAQAGVNIDAKSHAIQALVKQLTYRRSGKVRMIDLPGQFTGLIDFGTSRSRCAPTVWAPSSSSPRP